MYLDKVQCRGDCFQMLALSITKTNCSNNFSRTNCQINGDVWIIWEILPYYAKYVCSNNIPYVCKFIEID